LKVALDNIILTLNPTTIRTQPRRPPFKNIIEREHLQ
jgi:hypothetical protein